MNKYLMMLTATALFTAVPVFSNAWAEDHAVAKDAVHEAVDHVEDGAHDVDCKHLPEGAEVPEECKGHEEDEHHEKDEHHDDKGHDKD